MVSRDKDKLMEIESGTTCVLELSNSLIQCFVDEGDYDLVSQYSWHVMLDQPYIRTSKRVDGKRLRQYIYTD